MVRNRLIHAQALMLCAILLAACGGGDSEGTPTATLSQDQIQTAAIETFAAALTQTALAAPSDTPVPTLTASPTSAPFTTTTAGGSLPIVPSAAGTTTSCYRLVFVSDVSIPDNTPMTPGQAFTKTWKVSNTGSCPWDAGFKFGFVSGEAMGGATFTLASAVPPNATFDISVPMTTPNKTGTIRGDWRMSTAAGVAFGDIVYVQIVVGGSTGTATTGTATSTKTAGTSTITSTATSTATATATVTPTSTP